MAQCQAYCYDSQEEHEIDRILSSLDVTHVHWVDCLNARKRHFQGKEGIPTIALEVVTDFNLWIWHDSFG